MYNSGVRYLIYCINSTLCPVSVVRRIQTLPAQGLNAFS